MFCIVTACAAVSVTRREGGVCLHAVKALNAPADECGCGRPAKRSTSAALRGAQKQEEQLQTLRIKEFVLMNY